MGKYEKVLSRVLSGNADANVAFDDLCWLLHRIGYVSRTRGSHRVFSLSGAPLVNLQPAGSNAKPYQVVQVRNALIQLGITEATDDENSS